MKDKHNLFYIDIVRNPVDKSVPKKISHYSCEHYTETYVDEGVILGLINGGQTDMEILINGEDTEVFIMNINGKTLNILKGDKPISPIRDNEKLLELLGKIGIDKVGMMVIEDWDNKQYKKIVEYTQQQYLYINAIPAPILPTELVGYVK